MSRKIEETTFTKKIDIGLWRKLAGFLKPYRRELTGLALVMICAAGIDALIPIMTRNAIDNYVVPGNLDGLRRFGLGYFALILMQGANVWMLIAIAGRIEVGLCYDIRRAGFQKLQELSFSYYDRTPVGWIVARINSDSMKLGETISWGFVDGVWGVSMMIAVAVFMLVMNWKLALAALSVVPLLALFSVYFQQKILAGHRKVRKTNSKISGAYNEGIGGAKTSKTLVLEDANLREFQVLTGSMRTSSIRTAFFSSLFLPVVLMLSSIGTAVVLWYGGSGVIAQVISYGTMVAFISYTIQFFEPVRELARVLAELQSAQASAERIMSMMETSPDVIDKPGTEFFEDEPKITGRIEFDRVSFQYIEGEKVLEDFSLTIEPGETVALVGESGSGKSTIVNLACRFYEPSEGFIRIDGIEYREKSQYWLHRNLGYVLQNPHLFSGTIRENIRYGRLDASDAEVEQCARLVNAHEFITTLEKGYDSQVGEGGAMLSVGEKQLICFARALLADPALFVLDEATSSIDTETEELISRAIEQLLKDRTSFIIAHRLSTVRHADRILVLHEGKVIEEGNHKQLMALQGAYFRLYTNQFIDHVQEELLQEAEALQI